MNDNGGSEKMSTRRSFLSLKLDMINLPVWLPYREKLVNIFIKFKLLKYMNDNGGSEKTSKQ
jgi:hypothetical protein